MYILGECSSCRQDQKFCALAGAATSTALQCIIFLHKSMHGCCELWWRSLAE